MLSRVRPSPPTGFIEPCLPSPADRPPTGPEYVHPSAKIEYGVVVDPGAVIGPRAAIGAGTVIGATAVIGPDVHIGRERRDRAPSNDLGPSSPHKSCPACIIATRGYDFRDGQGLIPRLRVDIGMRR
jgi:hypothetical protein